MSRATKKQKTGEPMDIETVKETVVPAAQEIAAAVKQGVPPSNKQIEGVIDSAQQFLDTKQSELPPAASKAVGDLSQVLEDTKEFIREKNPDEALQKTIVHAKAATEAISSTAASEMMPKSEEWSSEISETAKEVFESSTNFARQLVTSGEFRRLLIDLINVVENLVWRVQSTTEEKTNEAPSIAKALKTDIAQEKNPLEEGLPRTQIAAQELKDKLQYALRDESSFTDEERRLIRERFRDVLLRIKKNNQFQKSIHSLSSLFNYLKSELSETLDKATDDSQAKYNFDKMTNEAGKFLQRFASKDALNRFYNNLTGFVNTISKDQDFDQLLQELRGLFNDALENPEILLQDQGYIERAESALKRLRAKLAGMGDSVYLSNLSYNAQEIINSIMDDPLRQKLASDAQILVQNFFNYDEKGTMQLNTELLNEMKALIVPLLIEQLKWVPLPRIQGSNETYDYWFDNVVFSAPDLVPDQIHIRLASEGDFDVKNLQTDNFRTFIRVSAEGIKTTLNDVQFWFRRKTFPKTEDTGFATLDITQGNGIKVDLIISVSQGTDPFQVRRVDVSIDGMSLQVADTKHDWLYNTLSSLFAGVIKTRIEQGLKAGLQYGADIANIQLNRIAYKTYQEVSSAAQTSVMQQASY